MYRYDDGQWEGNVLIYQRVQSHCRIVFANGHTATSSVRGAARSLTCTGSTPQANQHAPVTRRRRGCWCFTALRRRQKPPSASSWRGPCLGRR